MPEDTIAGYRVLRKLGSGSRSDVYLGHCGALAQNGGNAMAALKCFRAGADAASIDHELAALSTVSHPHVVHLRDVSRSGAGAPILILERLEQGTLGHLLARRAELGAGEAVTLLAPLTAALAAVHESGFVHGGVAANRVQFRGSGAPVLSGFGYACALTPAGVDADNRALASLSTSVLERVPGASSLSDWLASLSVYPDAVLVTLSERLFELAEATPVRFDAVEAHAEAIPSRVAIERAGPVPVVEPVETPARGSAIAALTPYLQRIPPRFRSPKYAAGAAGVVALLIAIAVVPSGGTGSAALTPTLAPTAAASGPVLDDDPVAAFRELVAARNQCIRDLSILCLETVLQENSGAMDDDVALIQSIERGDGGGAALTPLNVELGERMGDAALVTYETGLDSEPASALLVKSEAGWRIRTYIERLPATG